MAEGVAALKEQDGLELQVHGSQDLLQTLIPAGLVDRYRLLLLPVVPGSGKRLFADGAVPAGLRPREQHQLALRGGDGHLGATGALVTGSFGS